MNDPDSEHAQDRDRCADRPDGADRMPSASALVAWGLATIAFFALVDMAPREWFSSDSAAGVLLLTAPVIFAAALPHRTFGSVLACARGGITSTLISWYVVLFAVAVATDALTLRHGSLPALFTGVVPALPCFAFAWRLKR